MTVYANKPAFNVREKLKELEKPSGIAGHAMLAADTPQEQFNLIGAGRRNLLINSGFTVNQRGADVTNGVTIYGVNNYFTVDHWNEYNNSGVSRKVTVDNNVLLPNGTRCNSYKSEHISGTATWLHPVQKLEFENWMHGQTFTVSVWVKTSIKGFKIRVCDTITCYLIGSEIPNDGEWHYMTASVTLPSSGLTIGSYMQFQPAFGTASPNLVAGDYIEFALMQVELGNVATPFEYRTYAEELALCQRYCYVIGHPSQVIYLGTGSMYTTTAANLSVPLPVQFKNTAPSFTAVANGTGNWLNVYIGATGTVSNATPLAGDYVQGNVRIYIPGAHSGSSPSAVGAGVWSMVLAGAKLIIDGEV